MPFKLNLNPRQVGLCLGIISVYLAGQSLAGEYLLENVLDSGATGLIVQLIDLFSVNAEETIPTWYATLLLFMAAVLLALITAVKRKTNDAYFRYWLGLTFIFLYLSMDEGAVIHEIFVDPLQTRFNTTGYLAFAWQILFVPLVVIIALLYLRFWLHLPPRTRNLLFLAGLLYVGGATVIEAFSANRWYLDNGVSFTYLAIATVEELCEMLGVVVFIVALLLYLSEAQFAAVVSFSSVPSAPDSTAPSVGRKHSVTWQWLLGAAIVLVAAFNLALFSWASAQSAGQTVVDPRATPFYQTVTQRYAGQGVIILGINEVMAVDNPAAQPIATSLLTLFDDVMVVSLPAAGSSIAFASHQLPFDQSTLAGIVRDSGESDCVVLSAADVGRIAGPAAAGP